jgi:predicted AAA+ superfamily ATPase
MLAIKHEVDVDPRPGRFLLTGSARLFALRDIPDLLPGRSETIELWPLSQGEISCCDDRFVEAVFEHGTDVGMPPSDLRRADYLTLALRGGYPEAVRRADPGRRTRFFESYVSDLVNRDVRQVSQIERPADMRRLLNVIAVLAELARQLSWADEPVRLYHYRDRDGHEVGAILEHASGEVVAVEVKAAETVRREDFRGIQHLVRRLGGRLLAGIVLYAGGQALPFGDRLRALPICAVWTAGSS